MAKSKESQNELLWYSYNMSEERDFKSAVKAVQKICRSSLEYDLWQTRSKAGSEKCPCCNEYYSYIKAETHHYPKTMFDICEQVVEKHVFDNTIDELSGFGICQEVMNEHFLGNVDFIVLCKSCHEKFHAGHPEVSKQVAEIFAAQKNNKPVENQKPVDLTAEIKNESKTELISNFDLKPLPIPELKIISESEKKIKENNFLDSTTIEEHEPDLSKLQFPPLPNFTQTESGMVMTIDGIEIDI
jgi:hypothetical protein